MTPNTGNGARSTQGTISIKTKPKSQPQRKHTLPQKKAKLRSSEHTHDNVSSNLVLLGALALGILLGTAASQCPNQSPSHQNSLQENLQQFKMKVLDEMQNGGCVGINKFITFTNFSTDISSMKEEYLQVYSPELGNPLGNETKLFPPAAMSMGFKGIDCEDAVLFTSCLLNYYKGVSCEMYYSISDKGEQHVGLECLEQIGNSTYYSRI